MERSDDVRFEPATWRQKVGAGARFAAVVGMAAPTTTLLPLPLTQLLTRRFRREVLAKKLHFMVQWARASMRWVLGAEIKVTGRHHLPRDTRGYMYVSNHQSYVDILVLMSALDTVAFLSKSLVRKIPFVGRAAYMGGTVFFARNSAAERQRALEETLRMCRESTAVVVFPEGTRSSDGNLREKIYPRAMAEAHRRGLKVIPVGLHGTYKIFPKSMDRIVTGLPVAVHIGVPLDPEAHPSREKFVEACWSRVAELHEAARRDLQGKERLAGRRLGRERCSAETGARARLSEHEDVSRDVA
jgi:1-acyl-sn-glycerol-3-phosphate acyltransferase